MTQKHPLGFDVYLALAAVGWADGRLDEEEADAIVRTAVEEGLELSEIEDIEHATRHPVDIGTLDRSNMSKEDRMFVYAVACWMTKLDGAVSHREGESLNRLASALKLPEGPRAAAEAVVHEVMAMSEDVRPARYDLHSLRRLLGERLLAGVQEQIP